MASCPNKNTPEWKQLEAVQGEDLAYALWEKFDGNPPAKFYYTEISTETFTASSYDTRDRFNIDVHNDILDTVTFMLMDNKSKKDFDLGAEIGNKTTRGAIPNMFLQQTYVTEDGTPVDIETAKKLFKVEREYMNSQRRDDSEQEQDVLYNKLIDAQEEADVYESDHPARAAFIDIYEHWNGGILQNNKTKEEVEQDRELGNVDIVGWRELLAQRSREFGSKILTQEEFTEFATDEEVMERIYSKSRLQDDPSKKLSGQMRELLATIKSKEANSLGYKTFLPIDQVYKELSATFAGLQNFPEMLAQMETLALHKPKYEAVSEFMRSMNKAQAAMFTTVFAQSANEFLLIRVEKTGPNGDVVRMFNPNENSVERAVATQWKRNAVESNIRKDRPVYTVSEEGSLLIDDKKATTIGKNWEVVRKAIAEEITVLAPEGEVSPGVEALSNILWEMGMNFGDPDVKADTSKNLQQLINKGLFAVVNGQREKLVGIEAYNYIADRNNRKLSRLVQGFVVLNREGTKATKNIKQIGPGQSIFDSQSRTIRHLASFAPLFVDAKGDSFVNGKGKQIYPINLRHHMGQMFEVLSSSTEEQTEMMDMYKGDKFFKPVDGQSKYDSILLRLLENNDFRAIFRTLDLDALKDVTIPDGTVDYENFSENDAVRLRLINYVNTGNKKFFFASIPIQADRKKFTVFPFARTSGFETTKSPYGISGVKRTDIMDSLIVQDLMRIAHGKGSLESQNGVAPKDLSITYEKNLDNPKFMQFDGTKVRSEGNLPIVEDKVLESVSTEGISYVMSDYIEEFIIKGKQMQIDNPALHTEMQSKLTEMVQDSFTYFNDQAKKLSDLVRKGEITLPLEVNKLGGVQQVIKDFVFDDFIARNEISKFARGSRAHSGTLVKFYKRMGQFTTPGVELARASDLQIGGLQDVDGIADYGAPDTFNEITLEDVMLNLDEGMISRARERAENIRQGLKDQGVEESLADTIADAYLPGEVEGTDGQSLISLDFYRDVMQGRGMWNTEEDKAWEAYTKAPEGQKQFVYQEGAVPKGFKAGEAVPTYPLKPYYERNENTNGVVTTDSHKNSYHVLLEAETKNNPIKNNLRRRMEAVGEYQSMDKIHVANFVTAKKIKINKVTNLTDNLGEAQFNTLDIRGLRFPQDIPTKKASTTMLNRQLRKGTITNINTEGTYTLNAGLDSDVSQTSEVEIEDKEFNPDIPEGNSYPINVDGKYAGVITVDNDGAIMSSIGMAGIELEPEFRKKGLGKKSYIALNDKLNVALKSENKNSLNEDSEGVWKSLVKSNLAEDKGNYYEFKPTQQTNEIESKKVEIERRRGEIKDFRTEAKEDIGNSVLGTKGQRWGTILRVHQKENTKLTKQYKLTDYESKELLENEIDKIYDAELAALELAPQSGKNEINVTGKELLDMYHKATERKIELEFAGALKELGIDEINKATKNKDAAAINAALTKFHIKLRDKIKSENLERELPSNYDEGLRIIKDAVGRPQFEVPLDFPVYFERYQRIVMGVAINAAFKQKVPGMEAVQVAEIGGYAESGELEFYTIKKDKSGRARVAHMEIMIREDIARKFGLEVGQDLNSLPEELRRIIGYRVPNQGKSSTVIMKIKRILPANFAKAVVVPAQITKLMGSDFDVDKLFLLFPEIRKTDAGPVKVRPPYADIIAGTYDISKTGDVSILNNILLDSIEAVQSSLLHVDETMAPLDETTLETIVKDLEQRYPDLKQKIEFSSATIEVEMGIRNTIGRAMRGLWANFLSGHSVAAYGNIDVNLENIITLDGKSYPKLINRGGEEVSEFDRNIPINMIGSRYLSAAVDAANTPYQFTLNDRAFTYPVEAYWLAFTGDSKSLHDFLNVPMIRKFNDLYHTKYGAKPMNINKAIKEVAGDDLAKNLSGDKQLDTTEMTREQLSNTAELSPVDQYELLLNFLKFREAGQDLVKMFKVIAPDSMDGMNSIDSIKSYMTRRNRFMHESRAKGEQIFTDSTREDSSVIDQFLGDESIYPLQRGFSDLFSNVADMAAKIFPLTISPAMQSLDTEILDLTGQDFLAPEAIRDIRMFAMLKLLTEKDSPLREFFSKTHFEINYLDKNSNLVTKLRDAKIKYPELIDNLFIQKFVENGDNDLEETKVFVLDFDTSYQMNSNEKNSVTTEAYKLLKNTNPEISRLAEDLLMNSLIRHGFRQTSGSYADLIPVSFFTEPRKARYGGEFKILEPSTDFLRKQQSRMLSSESINNFATDFLRHEYMKQPGGFSMLRNITRKTLSNEVSLQEQEFKSVNNKGVPTAAIVIYGKEEKESALYIAGRAAPGARSVKNVYVRVNSLGVDGKLIEAGSSEKSVVNTEGLTPGQFKMNIDTTSIDKNAGEVITTANQQDIICG